MSYISFQPQDYFNTKLWTGTGSSNAITGVGFQPDFCWVKSRSLTENHFLNNAINGSTKVLQSDTTAAEQTSSNGMTAFNSDGFTVNTDTGFNGNGATYASWNWKANGQGSSNTDGSINTTYTSANTTSGFSIVTYTGNATQGATIGHGLGVAPAVVLVKRLNATSDWVMYHKGMGASKFIVLNTNAAEASSAGIFYNTAPTSSFFYVGDDGATNASGGTYVAYCFAEKKGFSKFGSYIGNQNANGTFTFTGFKPAFVMIKNATQSGDRWIIHDDKRDPDNGCNHRLFPDGNIVESTSTTSLDFLSNGFKQRTDAGTSNTNGQTYIYMAFASEPLVSSNGVPAVAR